MSKHKRPKHYDFDLLVIGSGSGGGVVAHMTVRKGKKVALVEEEKIGGECPNWGCVPTKALIHSANTYVTAKEGADYGVRATSVNVNWTGIKRWKDKVVSRTGTDEGEGAYSRDGIHVIKGHAHFLSPHEISVGRKRYTAKKFVIATGASNFVPPIDGIKSSGFITHREAGDLKSLPKSMFIIGGGAIGTEFTHIFSSLGVQVYQAEFAPRLLAREDKEVGELAQALFERNGVKVLTETEVFKVEKDKSKKVVHYRHKGKKHSVRVDEVMLAAGMRPNTDLGLENAGVDFTPRGIRVDETMQTSKKHIYAVGDCVGPYAFTHMASYQSRIAAHNIFSTKKIVANYHAVPRCVFTFPEIACVGMTEAMAREKKIHYKKNAVPVSIISRANTSNDTAGFVKVLAAPSGVLIGASIVSPRAGEIMHELALAINLGLKAEDVAATIHAYPTWSESIRIACAGLE